MKETYKIPKEIADRLIDLAFFASLDEALDLLRGGCTVEDLDLLLDKARGEGIISTFIYVEEDQEEVVYETPKPQFQVFDNPDYVRSDRQKPLISIKMY